MVCPTFEDRAHGAPDPYGVQGFDQPALGRRTPGKKYVGAPIKNYHHRNVGNPPPRFLEVKVEADSHATHVPDLHVGDEDVGWIR